MADPDITDAALARAWSVYLLVNSTVDRNDAGRGTLERFIRQRCDAGATTANCWSSMVSNT